MYHLAKELEGGRDQGWKIQELMMGQEHGIFPGCCLQVSRKVDALPGIVSRCENKGENALPETKEQGINSQVPNRLSFCMSWSKVCQVLNQSLAEGMGIHGQSMPSPGVYTFSMICLGSWGEVATLKNSGFT